MGPGAWIAIAVGGGLGWYLATRPKATPGAPAGPAPLPALTPLQRYFPTDLALLPATQRTDVARVTLGQLEALGFLRPNGDTNAAATAFLAARGLPVRPAALTATQYQAWVALQIDIAVRQRMGLSTTPDDSALAVICRWGCR